MTIGILPIYLDLGLIVCISDMMGRKDKEL